MAIDTFNEKLALIEYLEPYHVGIPVSNDGLDQADKQQLLAEYPGFLWGVPELPQVAPWLIFSMQLGTPGFIVAKNDSELSIVKSVDISTPKIIGNKLPDKGRN